MGVELAHGAAVEPVVAAYAPARVAGEAAVLVGGGEDEGERVVVSCVGYGERHGGAAGVEVDAAGRAAVGEPGGAVLAAGAAVEEGGGEEGERVVRVPRVADARRHLDARHVERVGAGLAGVVGAGGGREGTTSTGRRRGRGAVVRRGELQRVRVAEVVDSCIVAQSPHAQFSLPLLFSRLEW